MIIEFKKALFFPIAYYFAFFAKIRLLFWRPRIVVVTGSSGKTGLLNLIETQIGKNARYSHHANSAIGIPFDILGLKRSSLLFWEWPKLFILAPINVFKKPYKEKLYIAEADCDRPDEGKFLANLLKPDIVLWTNATRTHSAGFDAVVKKGKFKTVDGAIAYEFGFFAEKARELCIVNQDSKSIEEQLGRASARIIKISKKELLRYEISTNGTQFDTANKKYSFSCLLPEEFFYSVMFTNELLNYLELGNNYNYSSFFLPPGRSSLFKGIKNTLLLDSTYNANLSSMSAILNLFENIGGKEKWAVIGDMVEQGEQEKEEHEKLADVLSKMNLKRIIFLGPRTSEYTFPKLEKEVGDKIVLEKFISPKDVLDYLQENIMGGELILFKGARFLEGVIEHLLLDKTEAKFLARREKIWEIRRKRWGL